MSPPGSCMTSTSPVATHRECMGVHMHPLRTLVHSLTASIPHLGYGWGGQARALVPPLRNHQLGVRAPGEPIPAVPLQSVTPTGVVGFPVANCADSEVPVVHLEVLLALLDWHNRLLGTSSPSPQLA